jgi:hypothetical protein
MNERIRQLATEVGISVEYLNNTKQWPLIEALAELIVKECCDIADQVERADMDSYVSKYIRAHFGVEK